MNESTRNEILALYSPERIEHVLGVEEEAVRLARRWGAEADAARFSALLHDCTKEWDTERHLKFIKQYNIIASKADIPKLLHGISGAALARVRFGAVDEICAAVRWHTSGRPDMSVLEKIVYLADKIEPSRDCDGELRRLSYQDIDRAMLAVMDCGLIKLLREGRHIHPDTLDARNYYLAKVNA
ncbi:MAG: bis(5'-nucleosyl)-tetraphosphatase (symmetrical) YqeK [Oscillospiraceae bacterium]|nr:bis(5'-nucleosyl)-tetraphosphatase (symmetrical) YqeK [Oscillospiraceae bacterium]